MRHKAHPYTRPQSVDQMRSRRATRGKTKGKFLPTQTTTGVIETIVIDDDDSDVEFIADRDTTTPDSSDSDVEFIEEEFVVLAKSKNDEGNVQFNGKNYNGALQLYSDAIQLQQENGVYYNNRASCHFMLGNYEAAMNDAFKAVLLRPQYVDAYIRLERCYFLLGDFENQRETKRRLKKLDPTNELWWEESTDKQEEKTNRTEQLNQEFLLLAAALRQEKHTTPESHETVEEVVVTNDSYMLAEEKKSEGNVEYGACNYRAAIRCYSEALELHPPSKDRCPNIASYYDNRACCHMMLKNYASALADARKAVHADPLHLIAYTRIVMCCMQLGCISEAETATKQALELDPTNLEMIKKRKYFEAMRTLERKINESFERKDYKVCVKHINVLLKSVKGFEDYQLTKAECFINTGHLKEAQKIVKIYPSRDNIKARLMYLQGLIHYHSGDLNKAISELQRALILEPEHKTAKPLYQQVQHLHTKLVHANHFYQLGKYREAITFFDELLATEPMNKCILIWYSRGDSYAKLNDSSAAIKDFTAALNLQKNFRNAFISRANAYMKLEEYQNAINDLRAAQKLKNDDEVKILLIQAQMLLHNPETTRNQDFYTLLGVNRNAQESEIRKAYKKGALNHHPDKHSNKSEEEQERQGELFKKIGEAYQTLVDPVKRADYDRRTFPSRVNVFPNVFVYAHFWTT